MQQVSVSYQNVTNGLLYKSVIIEILAIKIVTLFLEIY